MSHGARATIRGEHEFTLATSWRLDGNTEDAGSPLVLCLHGMGMDEDLFAGLLRELLALPFRFLIPRGPYPVEVRREGRIGAGWYAYDGDQERFRRELSRTQDFLLALLRDVETTCGLRPRARILLGFSQGGYCGSYVALRNAGLFDGMVVCSARVKVELLGEEIRRAAGLGFRALLCHGDRDESVSPEGARSSRDALEAAGVDVELRAFDGGHSLGREPIGAISAWLLSHFG